MAFIKPTDGYHRLPDYAIGEHYAWEVEKHKWLLEYSERSGCSPTFAEVQKWAERYFNSHTNAQSHRFQKCTICEEYLADCRLRGHDPKRPDLISGVAMVAKRWGNIANLHRKAEQTPT